MRVKFLIPFLFVFLMIGCQQKGRVEFIECVQNHKTLTVEVLDDVIWSIEDDLAKAESRMSPEQYAFAKQQIDILIEKLRVIQKQSVLIERYVMSEADQELISQLLKSRWIEATSKPNGE